MFRNPDVIWRPSDKDKRSDSGFWPAAEPPSFTNDLTTAKQTTVADIPGVCESLCGGPARSPLAGGRLEIPVVGVSRISSGA